MGRVAVIIGRGLQAANRGPCQCLPFGTLIARSRALQLLAVPSRRFRGLRSLLQCTGAGSNLAAVCQPILESQRQSLLRQQQILVLPKAAFRRTIETRLEAMPANPAEPTLTAPQFPLVLF